jgi:two-component system, OmpR family, response regulator
MMKILVVDDSELIRSRLVSWLQTVLGLTDIDTAGSLAQTLHCVKTRHPELVILDLHLPDGNALPIIPALKQIAPHMRIAMLTNDASEFNRTRCLQAGADWFFDKSTEFEKVLDLVQQQSTQH